MLSRDFPLHPQLLKETGHQYISCGDSKGTCSHQAACPGAQSRARPASDSNTGGTHKRQSRNRHGPDSDAPAHIKREQPPRATRGHRRPRPAYCLVALCSKSQLLGRVQHSATPWTAAHQAPLSMGFSRQEYCSGLLFPSPGDLPDPGIEPRSPALQVGAVLSELLQGHNFTVTPHPGFLPNFKSYLRPLLNFWNGSTIWNCKFTTSRFMTAPSSRPWSNGDLTLPEDETVSLPQPPPCWLWSRDGTLLVLTAVSRPQTWISGHQTARPRAPSCGPWPGHTAALGSLAELPTHRLPHQPHLRSWPRCCCFQSCPSPQDLRILHDLTHLDLPASLPP